MCAADATSFLSSPLHLKKRYLGVALLSPLEEGVGCQLHAPSRRGDGLVVGDENKDIQDLFLGTGTVKLHVQRGYVTYVHSSSKMDPSHFVT